MLQELTPFVMKHWALCAGFIVVAILVVIEEVRAGGPSPNRLSPAEATHLMNREDAVVIDVRDANVFREGHIVNAKNIALVDFDRGIEKLNRERPVILVDAIGDKTAALIERLKKAGFKKPCAIKNGMNGWKTAEMPIVKK
ncbi:MAG: rhodanese-like domain-containing protein [Coxiellaceae bacterium]|nr:rhodanese-like domain-containing protein [Coxiellaceae bacterium]